MNRFTVLTAFPTSLVVVDTGQDMSEDHRSAMMADIDDMIQHKKYLQINQYTPRWQSLPVLFDIATTPGQHWQSLCRSFMQACKTYLDQVENFCNNQSALVPTSARAWFYKTDRQLNHIEKNPWHTHTPGFLSGVFYLRVPGDLSTGGTEFMDPRGPLAHGSRDIEVTPYDLSWVIFPSWLQHRSVRIDTDESRYVIAADLYVAVGSSGSAVSFREA